MGVISEAMHGELAIELKEELLDAATGKDWGDVRSAVRAFAKKHALPKYLHHCEQSYGITKVDHDVIKLYE